MVTKASEKSGGFLLINSEGIEKVAGRIRILGSAIRDLSPLFEQMSADFYKDQKRIFNLSSRGQYVDLSTRPYFFKRRPGETGPRGGAYIKMAGGYKAWKQYYYGFTYPILFATGRLASSLLSRSDKDAVNIINPRAMIIGTGVPYAVYHHSTAPRKKIPRRMLWDETPESRMLLRWNRLVDAYMQKAVDGAMK